MLSSELQALLEKYLDETISKEDFKRLWKTLQEEKHDEDWYQSTAGALLNEALHGLSDPDKAREALSAIRARMTTEETLSTTSVYYIPFYRKNLFRYAAAVILVLGTLSYFLLRNPAREIKPDALVLQESEPVIRPGGEKALLTLADGTTIVLDSMANGQIAQQGQVKVIKLSNGQLQYRSIPAGGTENAPMAFNTMYTPRGGQYRLTLPDGTGVWLNAESSITYPVAFTGNERKVKISGEAYFEVFKDKSKPFKVQAREIVVEVLGTNFNINAYSDEGPVKTSLLEGSVKINSQKLKPGQAYMDGKIYNTDVEQDVAWKNGVFNFNDQNLAQVMRQLARWYNLEVVYPQGVPRKEYGGEMGRNLNLDQVLKGLENSGVHFDLAGRTLTVKP